LGLPKEVPMHMRLKQFAGAAVASLACLAPIPAASAAEIAVGPDMPVEKAVAAAKPGDVIVLPDGVHRDLHIDGQPRAGKLDVGCDQAGDAPILRRPLEPKDVGPSWMKGDPACLRRIENPKPIPAPAPAKKKTPVAPKAP
jgi:hypothetical protein